MKYRVMIADYAGMPATELSTYRWRLPPPLRLADATVDQPRRQGGGDEAA